MRRCLIVNADDFGLHRSINEGIEEACNNGIVRSVSFASNTDIFEESLSVLKRCREVSIGIHLNIIDGRPVSNGKDLGFLLDKKGNFLGNHKKVLLSVCANLKRISAIKVEFEEQIKRAQDGGLNISHLDSHCHIHLLPCLSNVVVDLVEKFKIPFVRVSRVRNFPFCFNVRGLVIGTMSHFASINFIRAGVKCVSNEFSLEKPGKITKEGLFLAIRNLSYGVTEINVHPSKSDSAISERFKWGYSWQDELAVLTDKDIREEIKRNDVALINFNEILENVGNATNELR